MVAFEEHFWGEKYNGFDALHTNYKQGISASKEFLDFIKERTTLEETYAKALQKLAHKCTSSFGHVGSFEPCWKFVQNSTEKLANVHLKVVQNLNDLAKALKEYNEQQKDKQKQMKDEFASMAEMVQSILALNSSVSKAKESYQARCVETEKSRKECTSIKEVPNLEKVESKLKKTSEEYKSFIEKREVTRSEFQTKLTETSKNFQSLELDHLAEVLAYLGRYGNCLKTERVLLDQIIEEFTRNMDAFKVSSLLEQFVCAKETGKDIPAPMEFEEVTIATPPVDIEALTNKEELKRKAKKERKTKKKKEKESKSTANGNLQNQDDTLTKEKVAVDEDGYSIRPADPDNTSLKSGKSRNSFSSDSGSDSDDDEPRKIQVKIKPKEEIKHSDASIDALKTMTAALTLSSPGTVHRRHNTGSNLDMSSKKLSRSNNALLDIEHSSNSDTASIKSLPSSTSLDTFQPMFISSMSDNTSKDNSFGDFDNLFQSSAFNSSASLNSDWASDFTVPSDVPKSSSEARQDDEETPPPLPTKNRSHHEEFNPLPRSSKNVAPMSPPNGSSGNGNESSVDKTVTLPRLKTVSGSQFPTLAPPIATRRNTSGARAMHHTRPQPALPQPALPQPAMQAKPPPQSSLVDLMDIFSAPPPVPSNSAAQPPQSITALSRNSVNTSPPSNAFQTSGLVSSTVVSDVNSTPSVTTFPRGDQQAPSTIAGHPAEAAVPSIIPQPSSVVDRPTPIAVAFIETVNAYFKGADQAKLMVKITGDMTVSFPSAIIPVLVSQASPAPLAFDICGANALEQIFPNKALVQRDGQLLGGDTMCFKFNMQALAAYLKKQSEQSSASFYNIDIIKYQVRSVGIKSTPLQLRAYWRCDLKMTDLKIDYEFNHTCMKPPAGLSNVSVVVPVDGGVEIMHSKPSATWSGENQRAVWKFPVLSQNSDNKGVGSLRARFEVSSGPSTPAPIAIQFSSDGSTMSNMKFELKSPSYKLSLVKRKFTSGKYLAEPIAIPEKP